MRLALALIALLATAGFSAAQPGADDKVVRVLVWADYVDPHVLDDFTRATGVQVVLNTYDSIATMDERIAGGAPYDVVVTPATLLAPAIKARRYQPLDYARLPNARGLDPDIAARLATVDPGNRYAIDYMWFATGIAYNTQMAADRLGNGEPAAVIDTWDTVFKPDTAQKFSDCGIQIIDEPDVLFPIALGYLRLSSRFRFDGDVSRASDLLGRLRAVTKLFSTPDAAASLANGNVCLAVVPADLAAQARRRASEARNDIDIGFAIPREGAPITFDVMAIPENATHVDAAHQLMDFFLRPAMAARNSNLTRFANGVSESRPLMDQALATDPGVYPSAEVMKRLFMAGPYDTRQLKLFERYWVKSKTGKLGS